TPFSASAVSSSHLAPASARVFCCRNPFALIARWNAKKTGRARFTEAQPSYRKFTHQHYATDRAKENPFNATDADGNARACRRASSRRSLQTDRRLAVVGSSVVQQ